MSRGYAYFFMCVCVCVCARACVKKLPHPPPYRFISEGVKHAERYNVFYFEFM